MIVVQISESKLYALTEQMLCRLELAFEKQKNDKMLNFDGFRTVNYEIRTFVDEIKKGVL